MQHLKVKGLYPRGPFYEQFPGLRPTLAQRRRYMRAFFQWHLYCTEHEEHERELRECAELTLANALIESGFTAISTVEFEYGVDEEVWDSWFENCPEESIPLWPWPCPDPEEGDPRSSKFADLLAKYKREGTLIPSPTEPTSAEVEETASSKTTAPPNSEETTNMVQGVKQAAPRPLPAPTPARAPRTKETLRSTTRPQHDDDRASAKKLCLGRSIKTPLQAATAAKKPDVKPVVDAPVLEALQAPIAAREKASFASTMTGGTNVAPSGIEYSFFAPGTRMARAAVAAASAKIPTTSSMPSAPVIASSSQAERPPVQPAEARLPPETKPKTKQTASMDLSMMADAMPQTSVKATLVDEKLFPYPCTPPDLGLRMMLWESNLPGVQPPYQEPFKLSLPADFGFWSLVWGQNGEDWSRIQREFVDDRVCLAWGYEEDYVGTTRKVIGTWEDHHLPNVMQWLSVGFVTRSSRDEDGFFKTNSPTNQKLVLKLWTTLNRWMEDCLSGQWTTLLSYLQRMEDRDIGERSTAKACTTLPSGYVAARTQYTSQRSAAEQNIKAIIRSESVVFDNVKPLLETWVDSFKEGYAMNRRDRIELAAHVWCLRVKNHWHIKIRDWAADMKKKARP